MTEAFRDLKEVALWQEVWWEGGGGGLPCCNSSIAATWLFWFLVLKKKKKASALEEFGPTEMPNHKLEESGMFVQGT